MRALKQKEANRETAQKKVKLRWNVLLEDLSLFMSLMVARFIIWQTLRRRRQERAARRQQFRLIHGNDHHAKLEGDSFLKSGVAK